MCMCGDINVNELPKEKVRLSCRAPVRYNTSFKVLSYMNYYDYLCHL